MFSGTHEPWRGGGDVWSKAFDRAVSVDSETLVGVEL